MRFFSLAGVACALSLGTLTAQTNQFAIYPEVTSFTSRAGVAGGEDGDILLQVDASHFRGVCQTVDGSGAVVGRVNAIRLLIQDQDSSTQESYTLCGIPEAGGGGPDPDPTNEHWRIGPFMLPPGGAGPSAWDITQSLATPFDGVPQDETFYYGAGVGPNALWTMDGVSTHMAPYTAGSGGDDPRTSGNHPAPDVTFSISRPGGPGTMGTVDPQTSTPRTHRYYLITEGSVLNWGADISSNPVPRSANPGFGVGGMYPRNNAGFQDGVVVRVTDSGAAGGIVFYNASTNFSTTGTPVPGAFGNSHLLVLGGALIPLGSAPLDPRTGSHTLQVAVPDSLAGVFAIVTAQAVTVDAAMGVIRFSNAAKLFVDAE